MTEIPIPPHATYVGLSQPLSRETLERGLSTEVVQAAIAEAAHAALLVWANDPNREYWVPGVMRVSVGTDDPDLFVRDLDQVKVEYTAELLLGKLTATQKAEVTLVTDRCDAPGGPMYADGSCRCLICARCGHHTGNANQGHHWSLCRVTLTERAPHFCCPGDCELEVMTDAG
jgi:hypothetical protein